ncbi:hypothetical protein [Halomonas sp.]|uniref:hypothetical protein n=1 Tax=Halomonas sp. TaxID=1486246 RepID=UPI0035614378
MTDAASPLDPEREAPELTLDLPRVVKHNWKGTELRDYWSDYLGPFPAAFKQAKVDAVLDDEHPRKLTVDTWKAEDVPGLIGSLPDEVQFASQQRNQGTTIAIVNTSKISPEAVLNNELDPILGMELQGVPHCCATAHHEDRQNGYEDPMASIARRTPSMEDRGGELVVESPHHILNTFWAYMGWRFIEFYPCSFECDRAADVASENGRLLREAGHGEMAEKVFKFIASPAKWSAYHGLAHVTNGYSLGEYTSDDNWIETSVRFAGYHAEKAEVPE